MSEAGFEAKAVWQRELSSSYTSLDELCAAGLLTAAEARRLEPIGKQYRVRVPRYYAGLIDRTDLARCPIRAQAIPGLGEEDPELPRWAQELSLRAFGRPVPWDRDAIGDLAKLAAPRLTHRYENRAILHLSSLCALYCRFCFRKSHLNDSERTLYDGSLEPALGYLRAHPDVRELILTGGDPLSLPDGFLARLFDRLASIPSLRHARVHSRMATTLPQRLTPDLAAILASQPFPVSLVSHFNHPRELSAEAQAGLKRLRARGVPLYNQSVLLNQVNDNADPLRQLLQELYEQGVRPFYLHHPDWTPGTFGFRLSIERGLRLMEELRGKLSGPALPSYVLDIPGGGGKVPLESHTVRRLETMERDGLGGALYELRPPHTRARDRAPRLFAEFWKA